MDDIPVFGYDWGLPVNTPPIAKSRHAPLARALSTAQWAGRFLPTEKTLT